MRWRGFDLIAARCRLRIVADGVMFYLSAHKRKVASAYSVIGEAALFPLITVELADYNAACQHAKISR